MATELAPHVDSLTAQNRSSADEGLPVDPLRNFLYRHFYFLMALLCVGIKVAAVLYIPAYTASDVHQDSVFHPEKARPPILWVHNFVFFAWFLFFVFQSALGYIRRYNWWRFSTWFGGVLGASIVLVGVATTIVKGHIDIANLMGTEAESYLIVTLYNTLVFGIFAALAFWARKKTELYLQFVFFAAAILLDTAFTRFDYVFSHHFFYPCIDLLIMIGVLRDLYVYRRIQKAYLIALPLLIPTEAFVFYTWTRASAWWVNIAHNIIG